MNWIICQKKLRNVNKKNKKCKSCYLKKIYIEWEYLGTPSHLHPKTIHKNFKYITLIRPSKSPILILCLLDRIDIHLDSIRIATYLQYIKFSIPTRYAITILTLYKNNT